jgi:lipopolysaccharide/colanic/teichoic acid biosynthesis glycosyltransferase
MNPHQTRETPSMAAGLVPLPAWKRALDIVLILIALPLVGPVMLFITLLIRVVSPGPVLFKQERVGFLGRRFMCFKFRTMVVNAETQGHQNYLNHLMNTDTPMVKLDSKGDPRVIKFGSLLRSSGLDELPQLINVLRGDMSLVGPRPCLPYEYENYLPWQRARFNAAPGLTGLWQVSGKNRTTFVEMINYDIRYSQEKSLWLDLKIISKTVPALVVQMRDNRAARKSANTPAPAPAAAPASVKIFTPSRPVGAKLLGAQRSNMNKTTIGGVA